MERRKSALKTALEAAEAKLLEKQLHLALPAELHKQLKRLALEDDRPMASYIRQILERHVQALAGGGENRAAATALSFQPGARTLAGMGLKTAAEQPLKKGWIKMAPKEMEWDDGEESGTIAVIAHQDHERFLSKDGREWKKADSDVPYLEPA